MQDLITSESEVVFFFPGIWWVWPMTRDTLSSNWSKVYAKRSPYPSHKKNNYYAANAIDAIAYFF